jgi:pseudomonalisin
MSQFTLNGATVFANTSPAQVPSSLSGTVLAVLGLNNIVQYHSDLIKVGQGGSPYTDPCTPPACNVPAQPLADTAFGPVDYQTAYDVQNPGEPKSSACCTNIASVADGDVSQVVTDLASYETAFGLPKVPVTVVYAGIPSADTSGQGEWDLDTQTSTGMAERVAKYFLYVATSLTDSDLGLAYNKWVAQDKAKLISISIGECEAFPYLDGAMVLDDEMFGEAALQGQTAFASSDDNGSACPAGIPNGVPLGGPPDTSYPASSPYVIAVGGTQLYTNSNFTYDFEVAAYFSGGGPSYFENPPFWQAYTGSGTASIVPTAEVNSQVGCPVGCRGVPDVAMCADPNICGALIFSGGPAGEGSNQSNGSYCCIGGTSLASPLAMGAWARIYCTVAASEKVKLGFAGPLIYQLANGAPTLTSPYFNDVIVGSNGLFTALPGYDYVTGLGSFDVMKISSVIPDSYPH